MASLRVHAEANLVFERINYNLLSLIVFQDIAKTVSLAYHRQNPDESHDLGYERLVEDVRSCAEYALILECLQDDKSIHEGVAMIWSDDHRSVCRYVFLACNLDFSVAVFGVPVYYRLEDRIAKVFVVNVFS